MSENVIFNTNPQNPSGTPPQEQSSPPPQEQTPRSMPQESVEQLTPEEGDGDEGGFFSSFPLGKILRIGGGILAAVLLLFIGITYVYPRFAGTKQEQVTLTYWGLWEDKQVMQSIIAAFEKENPLIKVVYEKQDVKQYREKLTTRIANGTGPDLYRFHNTWLPVFQQYLVPLPKDVIPTDEFEKVYPPVTRTDLARKGVLYGLPLHIDTLSLFVNTEIFKAAGIDVPTNWFDFIKVAKTLTVKDESGSIKTAGAAMGTYENVTHSPDIISLLMAQNGTNFQEFSATINNTAQALEFYTNFARGDDNVWDETLEPSLVSFAKGKLAMYFGYSWNIFILQAYNKELAFTIHPVPSLQDRKMTIASYWVEGVSNKSKSQKEALLFLRFLAKKETQQRLYAEEAKVRSFGEPYARTDLAATLKDNKILAPFVGQAPTAVSSFFVSDTFDNGLNARMNEYLGNAVRSTLGNASAESAAETLAEGVQQVAKQYGL